MPNEAPSSLGQSFRPLLLRRTDDALGAWRHVHALADAAHQRKRHGIVEDAIHGSAPEGNAGLQPVEQATGLLVTRDQALQRCPFRLVHRTVQIGRKPFLERHSVCPCQRSGPSHAGGCGHGGQAQPAAHSVLATCSGARSRTAAASYNCSARHRPAGRRWHRCRAERDQRPDFASGPSVPWPPCAGAARASRQARGFSP